jgi:hypothetical protein
MSYNNLENYFRTNFMLMEEHKYSLTEIENMMPFERQVYVLLVNEYIKKKEEELKQKQQGK